MTTKIAILTVQKWGNSLAVRLPAKLAQSAHFEAGTPVELTLKDGRIIVTPSGERKMTLDERLDHFDPEKHGGEVMASKNVGLEKLDD